MQRGHADRCEALMLLVTAWGASTQRPHLLSANSAFAALFRAALACPHLIYSPFVILRNRL